MQTLYRQPYFFFLATSIEMKPRQSLEAMFIFIKRMSGDVTRRAALQRSRCLSKLNQG
ncbi:MAG: hypothetical protein Dbin4_00671 [Alphaproteobacteria bacterium]|nr:hypothetical protein [Alphaproteobacteria bacterium]